MKKLMAIFLLCCMLCTLSITVYADKTHVIADSTVTVTLPDDFAVINPQSNLDTSAVYNSGYPMETFEYYMTKHNLLMYAYNQDFDSIAFFYEESDYTDFNQQDDEMLENTVSKIADSLKENNVKILKTDWYNHNATKFVRYQTMNEKGKDSRYGILYATIHNGYKLQVMFYANEGEADRAFTEGVINSIDFEGNVLNEDRPYRYQNSVTGFIFEVPETWARIEDVSKDSGFEEVFQNKENPDVYIAYSYQDIYEMEGFIDELNDFEKSTLTRRDLDNSLLDEFMSNNENPGETEKILCGVYEYLKVKTTVPMEDGSDYPMIQLIYIDNGYIHMFQLENDVNNEFFNDIKSVAASVICLTHVTARNDIPYIANEFTKNPKAAAKSFLIYLIVSLLITAALFTIPMIIYRYVIKKEPVKLKNAAIIVIIYGILMLILETVFMAYIDSFSIPSIRATILWSSINFLILISEKKKKKKDTRPNAEDYAPNTSEHNDNNL